MTQQEVKIPLTDEVLTLLGIDSFTVEEAFNAVKEDPENGWDRFKPDFNRGLREFSRAGRMPELLALIGR